MSPVSELGAWGYALFWGLTALAAGIFLGAGLIHMLPDSAQGYWTYGASYPWPFVICGATIMGLALLERLAWGSGRSAAPALAAAIALAAHSFLAGAALGATSRQAAILVLFLALIAHKGAASFSLAQILTDSSLSRRRAMIVQSAFVVALPLGVVLGAVATAAWHTEVIATMKPGERVL